jgi:hypothetical protein
LREHCNRERTTQESVSGQKATGQNGNSNFFPAAGYRSGLELGAWGTTGYYWSSSLHSSDQKSVTMTVNAGGVGGVGGVNRFFGFSIRPVYGYPPVPVQGVTFRQEEVTLSVGESVTLEAIVTPADATFPRTSWSYSYAVYEDGQHYEGNPITLTSGDTGMVVTAIAEGRATVTVMSLDGGKKARCKVRVKAPEGGQSGSSSPSNVKPAPSSKRAIYRTVTLEQEEILLTRDSGQ